MKYHIRPSHFSLVELSLLAHSFESAKAGLTDPSQIHQKNITETLLKMKATEKTGKLFVAIYNSDPVGFLWAENESAEPITWIHAQHAKSELKELLWEQLT